MSKPPKGRAFPGRPGERVALGNYIASQAESKARTKKGLSMFNMFPLLTVSLAIYAGVSASLGADWTVDPVGSVTMLSGEEWVLTGGDVFLVFSLVLLMIEILRATQTGTESILNHAFSAILFIACFACFLIVPSFGTSAFFLLTLMAFMDFMAGFIVTTLAARRDFGVGG